MKTILGINHQFLYPESMTNEIAHTETLREIVKFENVSALDCWVWRGNERSREEIKILKDSGKIINYNIGDRFGEDPCFPASPSKTERERAYSLIMREIGYALELSSKKIVIGSGPDIPNDREGAKERFGEIIMRIGEELPSDVELALEPTDWDIDKHFLFGPVKETTDFIHKIRTRGFKNFGMLLDMSHIPIMYETLETAIKSAEDTIIHIHLGNCIIKNPSSPYYGDRHVPWSYPESEYTEEDGIKFIRLLKNIGYLDKDRNTVSFEMRRYDGLSDRESLDRFVSVWNEAIYD